MSALAVSQIEKHFITNEIYKRSKRYFDVIKLKSIEHMDSKFRRIPSTELKEDLEKKIEDSFISSEDYFNHKRLDEIEKSKQKCSSFYIFDDKDETETNYSVAVKKATKKGKKTFDMSKALSREFVENIQSQINTPIEDPFDNYVPSDFEKGEKGKSIDFNKVLGRKETISKEFQLKKLKKIIEHENPEQNKSDMLTKSELKNQNLNKIYEKFYFDQSKFKCLIDVEKERKAENRRSLHTSLKHEEPKEISTDRIEKARNFSQRNPASSSLIFYHGKGKEEPSQMHLKTMKNNQNYWIEQMKIMKKEDFETVKRRDEMIDKRLKEIKSRKYMVDTRGEICDTKFFLRNKVF